MAPSEPGAERTALAMVRASIRDDREAFITLGRGLDKGRLLGAMAALLAEFIELASQGQGLEADELLDAWALALASEVK